mmetsp:Transcript_114990/g.245573  ORF Transcript_114990/g.245573 Transcript_114990/m.245573 type:complete len:299 (-) Transcript_114990:4-900(-)
MASDSNLKLFLQSLLGFELRKLVRVQLLARGLLLLDFGDLSELLLNGLLALGRLGFRRLDRDGDLGLRRGLRRGRRNLRRWLLHGDPGDEALQFRLERTFGDHFGALVFVQLLALCPLRLEVSDLPQLLLDGALARSTLCSCVLLRRILHNRWSLLRWRRCGRRGLLLRLQLRLDALLLLRLSLLPPLLLLPLIAPARLRCLEVVLVFLRLHLGLAILFDLGTRTHVLRLLELADVTSLAMLRASPSTVRTPCPAESAAILLWQHEAAVGLLLGLNRRSGHGGCARPAAQRENAPEPA